MTTAFNRFINHKHFPTLFIGVIFLLCLVSASMSHAAGNLRLLLSSDQQGYFQYLPYFFIEGDLQHLPYADLLPNGNALNIYHIGVAILEAPFFLAAHAYAMLFDYELTGFSTPYLLSIFVAGASYLALACYLMTKILTKYFNCLSALITVSTVFLGTNLLYYASHEPGMSHIYSFFLFSLFLYQIEAFLERLSIKRCMLLGLTLGLITIVRPNNLILGLCIPFWGVHSLTDLKVRMTFLFAHPIKILIVIAAFGLAILPQLLYWNLVTGHFFVFSYGHVGQGFNWGSPALFKVLFSPQNGWLAYTPIMLVALIGLGMTARSKTHNSYAILTIMIVTYYIISSWWAWWFGAAFGHRAFIAYYPLLMIPFAFVVNKVINTAGPKIKGLVGAAFLYAIFLNLRMTYLYHPPWDGPDWGWDRYVSILRQASYLYLETLLK